jgi:Zn finger protein HypA/HybF involved in hydrogenase expression
VIKTVRKIQLDKQSMTEALFLDRKNREIMLELAREGTLEFYVAGVISYFNDDVKAKCSVCKRDVFVRPWAEEIIKKSKIAVLCVGCASKEIDVQLKALETLKEIVSKIAKPLET